tara:strand:- start:701 stop:934 length:234 start_codon:yes stop_codon:yes gene_type:complete
MSETKIKDVIDNNIEKFMAEVERQENSAMGLSKMIHKSLASVLIRNTFSDIFQVVQEKEGFEDSDELRWIRENTLRK